MVVRRGLLVFNTSNISTANHNSKTQQVYFVNSIYCYNHLFLLEFKFNLRGNSHKTVFYPLQLFASGQVWLSWRPNQSASVKQVHTK
jgi:hypothetical protein